MLSSPLSALPRWPLSPRFSAKAELDDETWLSFTGAAYVIIIQRRWRGKVARKNVEQRRALARALESARAAGQTRRRRVTRTLLSRAHGAHAVQLQLSMAAASHWLAAAAATRRSAVE